MQISEENNPLYQYFITNQKKIIHKWMHYFDIYNHHFQRFKNKECVVLEIGVSQGGSLQMWQNYLGNRAKIYGVDIDPACKKHETDEIEIFIGSQSDRNFLQKLKTQIPKIDILIDDGGHEMEQQIILFEEMYNHIKNDGIYLCEDTHTSYWKEFGGGYRKPGTFIEFTKSLIDQLNAFHSRSSELPVSDFTKSTNSIHFYDSIIVIEKKERMEPWHEVRPKQENISLINQTSSSLMEFKLRLLGVRKPDLQYLKSCGYKDLDLKQILKEKYDGRNWPEEADTMIGYLRLNNIEACLENIIHNQIEGDVIETGVWRGGACILMRAILNDHQISNKKVWVADSFQGLPVPNPNLYPIDSEDDHHSIKELSVDEETVKSNFRKYQMLDEQVLFLKGWFKDTMPNAPIQKLSILRLDGDMYESTIDVLFYLYPKLSIGGFCIIDDWGAIEACKIAVNDYRKVFNINEEIQIIDWTGIFWKKEHEILPISRSRFDSLIN